MDRAKAEVVQIKPDIDRVIATVAYVIHAAERAGFKFSQYDVVKSMFLADRAHLNEFGRLISTDRYVAMVHGPVPSTAYNLLKEDQPTIRRYDLGSLPWRMTAGPKSNSYSDADISLVDDILSPSDKSAIESSVATIGSLSFSQIRKLTHEDPAYVDAWEDSGDRKQFPISLGMLFDAPNFERARELSEMSDLG